MRAKFGVLAVLVMLVWAVSAQAEPLAADALANSMDDFGVQQPRVHKQAPDFSLAGLNGKQTSLSHFRGQLVLLHFWATWCVACRHEMPQIEALWRQSRAKGLVVLGVNVDRGNASGVRDFVRERNLSYPTVLDPSGNVRNRYEIRALPSTYIIGRDGMIIGRIIGERNWSSKAAHAMLDAILNERK